MAIGVIVSLVAVLINFFGWVIYVFVSANPISVVPGGVVVPGRILIGLGLGVGFFLTFLFLAIFLGEKADKIADENAYEIKDKKD